MSRPVLRVSLREARLVIGRLLLAAGLPPGAVPAVTEFVIVAELAAPAGASALRYLRAEFNALRADARHPGLPCRHTGPGQVSADAGGRAALLLAPDLADLAIATAGIPASSIPASSIPASSIPASSIPASSIPASSIPASPDPGGLRTAEVRVTSIRDPVFLAALGLPDVGLHAAGLGPVMAGSAGAGPGGTELAGAGYPPGYRLSARIPCGAARGIGSAVVTCTVLPGCDGPYGSERGFTVVNAKAKLSSLSLAGEPGPAGAPRAAPHPAIAGGLAVEAGLWDWLCDAAAAALTPDTPQSRRHAGHLAPPRPPTECGPSRHPAAPRGESATGSGSATGQ